MPSRGVLSVPRFFSPRNDLDKAVQGLVSQAQAYQALPARPAIIVSVDVSLSLSLLLFLFLGLIRL